MTHLCCVRCRLRFMPAAAASLAGCPGCGEPLQELTLDRTFGFRIFSVDDGPPGLPYAVSVSLPAPDDAHGTHEPDR